MTRQEAINVLENPDVSIGVAARIGQDPEYWRKLKPALDMAISALRQQETVTNRNGLNEPLTLDELRKMDGEPVWVEHYNGGEWVVVHWNIYGRITTAYNAELRYDEYGERWTAYRQKPEEGTE